MRPSLIPLFRVSAYRLARVYTPLSSEQLEQLAKNGWNLDHHHLTKQFKFPTHSAAAQFVMQIAAEADRVQHHPDVSLKYNRALFQLRSNDSGNLSNYDMKLADLIDTAFSQRQKPR